MDGECSFNLRIIIMYCTYMHVQLGSGSLLNTIHTISLPYAVLYMHAYSPVPVYMGTFVGYR